MQRRFLSASHARRFALARRLYAERPAAPAALSALSGAWAAASRLHGVLRRAAAVELDRPVLSVGGLGIGGSGKTPFVRWIARTLADRGRITAVLTRGHGWVAHDARPLVLLPDAGTPDETSAKPRGVPEGSPAKRRALPDEASARWRAVPDEARLFLRDGCAVGAHPRRAAAAAALVRAGARPRAFLLDDGFQHRQLLRDWDLVLLSARDLGAPRRPPPAGPFREPWSALRRADRLAITGLDADGARVLAGRSNRSLGLPPGPPPVLAGPAWVGLVELEEWLVGERGAGAGGAGAPLVAFSGVADPVSFEWLLTTQGLAVEAHVVFPDHHRFTTADRERLLALRPARGALVTTEKDAARLPAGWAPLGACLVAVTELRVWRGEGGLVDDLVRLVPGGP